MSNTYFQFKQFRIEQDQCAMKVSTDACLLGAVTSTPAEGKILDIGTGTGILSLLLAQRCHCMIDAAELDEASFRQAASNVAHSKWNDRIHVVHTDIRLYHSLTKYALIICNPPFYENHFKSPSSQKNKAKHAEHLSYQELLEAVKRNLSADGVFSVLLPANCAERFMKQAVTFELHPHKRFLISEDDKQPFKRHIILFSQHPSTTITETALFIRDAEGNYSSSFRHLMHPYYLYL